MFRRVIALVLFLSIPVLSQTKKPEPAEEILKASINQAKLDNKNVLVIFHASWCGWCKRLDKAITSNELKTIFENNFIISHLDVLEHEDKIAEFENPGGREIMKKFGGEKSGLPFYVFLDPKGNKIADSNVMPENSNIGYPGAPDEIDAFIKIVKISGKNLTKGDLEKIAKYLTDNAPKPKG